MSKVTISPLLSSLFRTSDSMTKEEATTLCSVLSEVGNDGVSMSLAQSTSDPTRGLNYVILQGEVDVPDVCDVLVNSGWDVASSQERGNEGNWVFFARQ